MNKVVRLPDGRFITRKLVESDPRALAQAKPEEIWQMNEGKSNSGKTTYHRSVLVRDMTTSHIMNAMALLVIRARGKITAGGMKPIDESAVRCAAAHLFPVYGTMARELLIRLGQEKREPEPIPEATGRRFDLET